MVVGELSSRTELAILGAGPGGYVAALRAADAGLDVTLIEREQVGGTCLNVGCIPSKTLIEVADTRSKALDATVCGLDASVDVRMDQLSSHLTSVTSRLRSGVRSLLTDAGVAIVHGDASFARYDRVSIAHDDRVTHLEFDKVIIATGSRPVALPNFAFDSRIVSSTGALQLTSVPKTMAIIGGGYIGIELGTAWAKLGCQVTIVESADSILATTPHVLRAPVIRRLSELGVTVLSKAQAVRPTATGLETSDGTDVTAEVIVVAVGRRPNSDQSSLDILPLRLDATDHVIVDDQMRAARGIFAIGDIVSGPALAHKASAQAETAVDAILGRPAAFAPAAIPSIIFSDPEILTVGETLDGATERGLEVHRFPHAASARALTHAETSGATYVVTDRAQTVVGVHAVGPHVSELAGEAALAIEMAATTDDLALTIHAHPTMSETVAEAAWLARGMPLHIRT